MEKKALDVTNMDNLREKVDDVELFGEPGDWQLICKASSKKQGWMHSTKAMEIKGERGEVVGCLVQVSSHQNGPEGTAPSISQSVAWVPGVMIFEGAKAGYPSSKVLVKAVDVYTLAARRAAEKAEQKVPDKDRMDSKLSRGDYGRLP